MIDWPTVNGPAVVNEWHGEWDALDKGPRTAKKARQGVRYAALEALTVLDPETMELRPLKVGSHLSGGSVIGRIGEATAEPAHLEFAIRPAGRGATTAPRRSDRRRVDER